MIFGQMIGGNFYMFVYGTGGYLAIEQMPSFEQWQTRLLGVIGTNPTIWPETMRA